MTPGQILRKARQRRRLTQGRLARRAGTTQSAISRIERDELSPTVDTLRALLRLLGEELTIGTRDVDAGHDRSMLRANLELSASERVGHALEVTDFVCRNRGAARR